MCFGNLTIFDNRSDNSWFVYLSAFKRWISIWCNKPLFKSLYILFCLCIFRNCNLANNSIQMDLKVVFLLSFIVFLLCIFKSSLLSWVSWFVSISINSSCNLKSNKSWLVSMKLFLIEILIKSWPHEKSMLFFIVLLSSLVVMVNSDWI